MENKNSISKYISKFVFLINYFRCRPMKSTSQFICSQLLVSKQYFLLLLLLLFLLLNVLFLN